MKSYKSGILCTVPEQSNSPLFPDAGFDVVVLAASLGGQAVLTDILAAIPAHFPVPIIILTHMHQDAKSVLYRLLDKGTPLSVRPIEQTCNLQAGVVRVAQPGRHITVTATGLLIPQFGPRVSFARPSADVLLSSAAQAFGQRVLGVILTGSLSDGARGAEAVRSAGGVMMAQDPRSCKAPGMPTAAMQRGAIHLVLPPEMLAPAILDFVTGVRNVLGLPTQAA